MRMTAVGAILLAATTAWAAEPDGKALFESRCTECHESSKALVAKKDRAEWAATIEKMRGKATKQEASEAKKDAAKQISHWGGGDVNEKEAAAIAAYLAEVAGK
jgi:mono/diheme cytochrome c family protein